MPDMSECACQTNVCDLNLTSLINKCLRQNVKITDC